MRAVAGLTIALILAGILAAPAADAKGVLRVKQTNSPLQDYPGVVVRVVRHTSLTVASADGKGTLTFNNGACSFIGEVTRCFLYSAILAQGGASRPLDLQRGTLYVNLSGASQPLPLTSQQLPPNGVMMALSTKIGTIITLTGTIDSVVGR